MLSFLGRARRIQAIKRRSSKVRLELENLEDRCSPAKLSIVSGAAVGWAWLGGQTSSGSTYLNRTVSGDLAKVKSSGSSLAESYAHLSYWDLSEKSKQLTMTSKAYPSSVFPDAKAQVHTANTWNGGPGWIQITVSPTYSGEVGKTAYVSFSSSFQTTQRGSNSSSFAQVYVYQSGSGQWNLLGPTRLDKDSYTTRGSPLTLPVRVGSSFLVHMTSQSYATRGSMAMGTVRLEMTIS
jgi:hypothetical protein